MAKDVHNVLLVLFRNMLSAQNVEKWSFKGTTLVSLYNDCQGKLTFMKTARLGSASTALAIRQEISYMAA